MSFALVDANNFYASCETVFRPDLLGKPVAVLSNNDGCIIARSAEVKAMGVRMGEPYFKIKEQLAAAGVTVFSSNYALYADMSARMMQTLAQLTPLTEIYSIDECFVDTTGLGHLAERGLIWRQTIQQWTGLTVGVGFGPTKTLAKLANYAAKKYPATGGVVDLSDKARQIRLMQITPVDEVWGVGRRLTAKLNGEGIVTAYDLAKANQGKIRRFYNVVLARTVAELNGISCLDLEAVAPTKQQIVSSRSFGGSVESEQSLREAVATFTARAAEKLRREKQLCRGVTVFIRGNPFADKPYYANSSNHVLTEATNDTRDLTQVAVRLLKRIYQPGEQYKKAGIMLFDFCGEQRGQLSLFRPQNLKQNDRLMKTLDRINQSGNHVYFAGQGHPRKMTDWAMQRGRLSPAYTTDWRALPIAH